MLEIQEHKKILKFYLCFVEVVYSYVQTMFKLIFLPLSSHWVSKNSQYY